MKKTLGVLLVCCLLCGALGACTGVSEQKPAVSSEAESETTASDAESEATSDATESLQAEIDRLTVALQKEHEKNHELEEQNAYLALSHGTELFEAGWVLVKAGEDGKMHLLLANDESNPENVRELFVGDTVSWTADDNRMLIWTNSEIWESMIYCYGEEQLPKKIEGIPSCDGIYGVQCNNSEWFTFFAQIGEETHLYLYDPENGVRELFAQPSADKQIEKLDWFGHSDGGEWVYDCAVLTVGSKDDWSAKEFYAVSAATVWGAIEQGKTCPFPGDNRIG